MNAPLDEYRQRLAQDSQALARQEIEAAVLARRSERGGHTEWGLLCEDAGLVSLAFHEVQLALRDSPTDPVASFHLAQHYRERGDIPRALALLDRLLDSQPANADWLSLLVEILAEDQGQPRAEQAIARAQQAGLPPETADALRRRLRRPAPQEAPAPPGPQEQVPLPSDADCVRFHTLFSGREGVYARQWVRPGGEGGYSPVHEPLTPAVIRNHLLGTYTIGAYPLRLDGTATWFAIDLDINKSALQRAHGDHPFAQSLRDMLRHEGPRLHQVLREMGLHPLLENSGYKGRHLWVFLEQPETAETLHLFGRLLLAWQSPLLPPQLHLEFFPKQGTLKGKGLGNLIKLPLGIHRHTGRRSQLLDAQGNPVPDPYALLRSIALTPQSALYAAIERLKAAAGSVQAEPYSKPEAPARPDRAPGKETATAEEEPEPAAPPGPPPPPRAPAWTEADFETDRRMKHLFARCPVLAELKRTVDEHRRLGHEEQIVLIHSVGHVEGGPQAVNYLLARCVDVGPEKFMGDRLKGNPVSCPSIRKKIPHITRRVPCHCHFEYAKDRYPTPVLHLLTLPAEQTAAPAAPQATSLTALAERWATLERRRAELEHESRVLRRSLITGLRETPERVAPCTGGRFRLIEQEGVEELIWEPDPDEKTSGPAP